MKLFKISEDNGAYVELGAPLKVYYDITNRCNLNCLFCFKEKSDNESSLEQIKAVIKKVVDANIPDIVFIGGEPMCCPFLFDALEYAKGMGVNTGIVTNGTLFTNENAIKLKALVNNSISVSVHAPNDEMHDKLSNGAHVHTKIIRGLRILNENSIVPELAFTPVKENIPYLFDTIDGILALGIEISDVLVNRLIPFGNALHNWKSKEVDLSGQLSLLDQMDRLNQKYPDLVIKTGDALPFCVFEEKYHKYIARCDYAITLGWINDQNLFGKCMVRGCTSADSIDNHNLRELWSNSEAFLCHRHMKNLTDECRSCEWLLECGGGCACSGRGSTDQDIYLASERRASKPLHKNEVVLTINVSENEMATIHDQEIYAIEKQFTIRKERVPIDDYDCNYLFIPASSGAVIHDTIVPEKGNILWVSAIEKQIIIYLQADLRVTDIAKSVSYEFNIPWESSLDEVKKTIARLYKLGMVSKK